MDEDFPTSPNKRRRTMSPEEAIQSTTEQHPTPIATTTYEDSLPAKAGPNADPMPSETAALTDSMHTGTNVASNYLTHVPSETPGIEPATEALPVQPSMTSETIPEEKNSFLDVLMQHVEAESAPTSETNILPSTTEPKDQLHAPAQPGETTEHSMGNINRVEGEKGPVQILDQDVQSKSIDPLGVETDSRAIQSGAHTQTVPGLQEQVPKDMVSIPNIELHQGQRPGVSTSFASIVTTQEAPDLQLEEPALVSVSSQTGGILPRDTVTSEPTDENAEWEVDSSPYESSTDSDSSSDDSSSDDSDEDEDEDGDYAMLDPEEQARILMQGDGGSDDEGGKSKEKGENAALRTVNERPEEIVPKPDIIVTEDMKVDELGSVEAIVENTVLVKAKISGEYKVLESGSLLCLKDRNVIGVVSETLGRVEQPLYAVRFTNKAAIEEAGVAMSGTTIYYVVPHSTFIFTQSLKGIKGSDASNIHDEEVGDEEMEFSDDEAEADHKRQMKLKRLGRRDDGGRARGGRGRGRGNRQGSGMSQPESNSTFSNGALNYDDGGDDAYTRLARPSNLLEMMGQSDPREESNLTHPLPQPPVFNQRRGNQHSFPGRKFRGNRGGGRGGFNNQISPQNGYPNSNGNGYQAQPYQQQQQQMGPPAPFSFANQPHPYAIQTPPSAPTLTPQPGVYPSQFSPSPISPLPKQQFNFGSFPQQPPTMQQQYGGNQNSIQHGYAHLPPAGAHVNPAFNFNFGANNNTNSGYGSAPTGAGGVGGAAWAPNQAAAAQVARQLEELRRFQQQQQQ